MKFFGSSDSTAQASAAAQGAKLTRRSSSLAQLIKSLDSEETALHPRSGIDLSRQHPLLHRARTQDLQRRPADFLHRPIACHQRRGRQTGPGQQTLPRRKPGLSRRAVRYCAVLEPGRLSGRKPGQAGNRTALVAAQTGRHAAGLLPHPGSRPGCALLPLPHRGRRRLSRCSTSLAATEKREVRPASSVCNAYSTTATSKISSAISLPSNSFLPATTSAKSWSSASSSVCHPERSRTIRCEAHAQSKDPYKLTNHVGTAVLSCPAERSSPLFAECQSSGASLRRTD